MSIEKDPEGTVYVWMIDTFMSGWGKADGKTNRLIFVCGSPEEARIVMDNAEERSDTKNVTIASDPPQYYHKNWRSSGADYETMGQYVQIKTKEDYPNWYTQEAFS